MDENNLLVVTNIFPNKDGSYYQGVFVKEQIKFLKNYFDNVYVISPWPYGYKMFLKDYSYENDTVRITGASPLEATQSHHQADNQTENET
ncbi:MAG: hypothetical protein PWP39_1630 [Pyrococcus sp.]|nr:hypothetical protein [Pyrococcus sp.]